MSVFQTDWANRFGALRIGAGSFSDTTSEFSGSAQPSEDFMEEDAADAAAYAQNASQARLCCCGYEFDKCQIRCPQCGHCGPAQCGCNPDEFDESDKSADTRTEFLPDRAGIVCEYARGASPEALARAFNILKGTTLSNAICRLTRCSTTAKLDRAINALLPVANQEA